MTPKNTLKLELYCYTQSIGTPGMFQPILIVHKNKILTPMLLSVLQEGLLSCCCILMSSF